MALKLYPINGQILNQFLGFLKSERKRLLAWGAAWRVNIRNTRRLVFIRLGLCSGWNGGKKIEISAWDQMFTLWSGQVSWGISVAFEWRFRLLGYKNEWKLLTLKCMKRLFLNNVDPSHSIKKWKLSVISQQDSHRREEGVKRRNHYTKPYQHSGCIIQRGCSVIGKV